MVRRRVVAAGGNPTSADEATTSIVDQAVKNECASTRDTTRSAITLHNYTLDSEDHDGNYTDKRRLALVATTTMTTLGKESAFERLPPEIRNKILEMVLVRKEEIDLNYRHFRTMPSRHWIIRHKEEWEERRWPAILSTCRRFRDEGTPIYLGANRFYVRFTQTKDRGLAEWLEILHRLPRRWVSQVSQITFCRTPLHERSFRWNEMLSPKILRAWKTRAKNPDHRFARRGIGMPWFEYFDGLLAQIKRAGLTAQQLIWPGFVKARYRNFYRLRELLEQAVLQKYILLPLLKQHGLFDPQRPPRDVVWRLANEWGQMRLSLGRDAYKGLIRRIFDPDLAQYTFGPGDGPPRPERWYEWWSTPKHRRKALKESWASEEGYDFQARIDAEIAAAERPMEHEV